MVNVLKLKLAARQLAPCKPTFDAGRKCGEEGGKSAFVFEMVHWLNKSRSGMLLKSTFESTSQVAKNGQKQKKKLANVDSNYKSTSLGHVFPYGTATTM